MKRFILFIGIALIPYSSEAIISSGDFGNACAASAMCTDNCDIINVASHCNGTTTEYYGPGGGVVSCTRCASGATTKTRTINLGIVCDSKNATYTTCECSCSTTAWVAHSTGYEKRTYCDSSCASSTQYRCAAGYYGSSTNGTSGCTKCPTLDNNGAATSPAGSTSSTACCVAAGTTGITDVKGTYKLNAQCCSN